MEIILASGSPRRQDILNLFPVEFKTQVSNINEDVDIDDPYILVEKLSFDKAMDVAVNNPDSIVIGADTIVYLDGVILGKPKSKEEAFDMLKSLSGRRHEVITGISIVIGNKKIQLKDHETTGVFFKYLSDEEVLSYIETGEPFDKAGSYGIQGIGSIFIDKIEGCYFNVVGLPTNKLYNLLGRIGVNLLERK
ncbi:MAG: Maf family protein [Clostridium sp.]